MMTTKGKPTVLVVDDNQELAENLAEILGASGIAVRIAHDAASALAQFDDCEWSLVVTDIRMPEMDGVELLRLLKQRKPSIPVLVTSGYADFDAVTRAHESGAFAVVHKPIDIDDLLDLVHRIAGARTAVLIVEDDTTFSSNLIEILRGQPGILPHPAPNLAIARRLASEIDFDLVVLDLRLPDGDGALLTQELRHRGDGSLRPMVVISGYTEELEHLTTGESHISALAKPFALPKLIERVQGLLAPSR